MLIEIPLGVLDFMGIIIVELIEITSLSVPKVFKCLVKKTHISALIQYILTWHIDDNIEIWSLGVINFKFEAPRMKTSLFL